MVSAYPNTLSSGGRDSFKWSDVKESSHRENYLGHSLMAPVGRWQQGRDLNWYAKNKDASDVEKQARDEELRRVKEAEQDAMARALGLPVAPRPSDNANLTPLGKNEVRKAIQETTDADENAEEGRGIGFGSYGGLAPGEAEVETLAATGMDSDIRLRGRESGERDQTSRDHRSRRNRSRDADRRRDRDHHRDHSTRHRKDRDADRERSGHHHRRHREHREPRRQRSLSRSKSRSRSPRRDRRDHHRGDSRERRQGYSDRRHDRGGFRDKESDRSHRDHRDRRR